MAREKERVRKGGQKEGNLAGSGGGGGCLKVRSRPESQIQTLQLLTLSDQGDTGLRWSHSNTHIYYFRGGAESHTALSSLEFVLFIEDIRGTDARKQL